MAVFDFIAQKFDERPEERNLGLKYVFEYGGRPVQPLSSIESAAFYIRQAHPGGANHILIGLSKVQGMTISQDSRGNIAVLIGLLVPAVAKITDGTSNTLMVLESALKPGGSVGLVMADGSPVSARSEQSSPDGRIYLVLAMLVLRVSGMGFRHGTA